MAGLFKKRILNNDEEIASNSNAQRKAYTNEDVLKALGINEKFITNEETNGVLVRMLEAVENFDIEQIQTPEQLNEVLIACKKQIEVSKDGKKVFGMTNKEDNKCEVQQMELGKGNKITRDITQLNITKNEQEDMTITEILQRYGEMEMKKGADDIQLNIFRTKQIKTPGISDSTQDITMKMMKKARDERKWDSEKKEPIDIKFDARDVIEYDNQENPYPIDKAHEFRDSLKREYEEYIDEKNKLNPEVITDPNILKRNILKELGVSEKILSKPGLLVELSQMVDYAAGGQKIQTSADVDRVLENLRKTTEITDNQVSGIKANRIYQSTEGMAIDLTEGVKITVLENNEYDVENTKYARAFMEDEGFLDTRQESIKTRYREDFTDKTRLEKTKKEKMSYRDSQNIGDVIQAKVGQELMDEQFEYLADHLPNRYSDLQTMLGKEEYEEIWKDSRTKQQQMQDDRKRAEEQQEQEV